MNFHRLRRAAWTLGLACGLIGAGWPQPSLAAEPAPEEAGHAATAARLAAQVREIANTTALSSAKKEKRISTAVRITLVAATAYQTDPAEVLGIALELAEAAARAAPRFAEVIASSISFTPAIVRIDGAAGQIRSAAYAAAKGPRASRTVALVPDDSAAPAPPAPRTTRTNPPPPPDAMTVPSEAPAAMTAGDIDYAAAGLPARAAPSTAPAISFGDNSTADVTLDLGVRRDNNVYRTHENPVSDTISSVTPGVQVRFGQNSLAHGSLAYKSAFTNYANKTATNATLGSGNADFGYDTGNIIVLGGATYEQVNQTNSDVAVLGQQALFRRDDLGLNASVEPHLTGKISLGLGWDTNKTEYKTGGLIGSSTTDWPLKLYYAMTPKTDLSVGYTFSRVTPQLGGPTGRNTYANVGVRGSLTPKLTGNFSVGYRTQEVAANPQEHLLGFDGSFSYDATAKTSMSLAVSRNFDTGALGETLKSGSYTLGVSTDLSPQWQVGSSLAYHDTGYGPTVFATRTVVSKIDRQDSYWEGSLQATYLFSSWLSASADCTFSSNHSNVTAAQFSDSILSLMMGLRY